MCCCKKFRPGKWQGSRLAQCVDFLAEHGAYYWNLLGIPDLTIKCLIRLCSDVNGDVVSAWFFCTEMNSPKLIFVSSETTLYPLIISLTWANSELYRIGKMLIEKLLRNAIFLFWNVDFQKRSWAPIYMKWSRCRLKPSLNPSDTNLPNLVRPCLLLHFSCAKFNCPDARFSFREFFLNKEASLGKKKKKNRGAQFLDKVLLPALGIHWRTINHTHWKCLTSIFLYNRTLTVAMKSSKSGAQPIISLISYCSWNLQGRIKSYFLLHERHKNQQFQFSVQIGFCTVHQSCLEIDIWHMLWQYLHDLSTKYKQNSPYFDKYFHFVWIKLCWMFLIIVNWIKIYWHGIFNDKHVYCNWEKKCLSNANQL